MIVHFCNVNLIDIIQLSTFITDSEIEFATPMPKIQSNKYTAPVSEKVNSSGPRISISGPFSSSAAGGSSAMFWFVYFQTNDLTTSLFVDHINHNELADCSYYDKTRVTTRRL